ncbi:MAG TPA: protein kinase [Micromonosporaceae bacterium]|nr:protein kinase [Micromonosporaceae bacterium]
MRSFGSGTPLAGRYLLLDELARSTEATVWRGMDDVLGRPVAVKVFTGPMEDVDRAWISRRARTAARLAHPHVAAVYDYGEASSPGAAPIPFVVLELLNGTPLADLLATGPLSWPLAVRTAAEVSAALAAAHARGVVHGEVTPDNVMLTDAGAKLIGFAGPSRAPRVESTPADDVRGIGTVLGYSLLDTAPHAGTDLAAFAPVTGLPPEVPALCLACLALRVDDRPSSTEVARSLSTVVTAFAATASPADMPLLAIPAQAQPQPPTRRWSRGRLALGAAGLAAVLAISGTVTGVGADILATAAGWTGDHPATSGAATDGSDSGSRGGRPGITTDGTLPGPPASPGTTPTAHPSTPGGPPVEPTMSPAASEALARLRASVDEGRTTGEITQPVAVQLDMAIDDLATHLTSGRVNALRNRIDAGERRNEITESRAAALRAALDEFVAAADL